MPTPADLLRLAQRRDQIELMKKARPASAGGAAFDALQRLYAIEQQQAQFPGRRPGGSGETGLMPSNAQGWSDILNEQTEALDLQAALTGRPRPTVEAFYDAESFTPQKEGLPTPAAAQMLGAGGQLGLDKLKQEEELNERIYGKNVEGPILKGMREAMASGSAPSAHGYQGSGYEEAGRRGLFGKPFLPPSTPSLEDEEDLYRIPKPFPIPLRFRR